MRCHCFVIQGLTESHVLFHLVSKGIIDAGIVADLVVDAVCPVVGCHVVILAVVVAIDIESSPFVPHDIPFVSARCAVFGIGCGSYADFGNTLTDEVALETADFRHCCRTWLVVVVHHVHVHAFSTVAPFASPVVDDIVAHVHVFMLLCTRTRTQAWGSAFVVGNEVVVVRGFVTTPVAAVAVGSLAVSRILQTLCGDAPLNGKVLSAIDRQTFVDAPADRTMVDDDVVVVHRTEAVAFMVGNIFIAQAETHITDDDVVAIQRNGIVGYADAVAGSRLSGNGDVAFDGKGPLQMDSAGNVEDNGPETTPFASIAERALLTIVFKGSHVIDCSCTSTCGKASETFSTRESRYLRLCMSDNTADKASRE